MVSRNVTMGQTVAASFQTPTLFLIATDLTKMQVDTNVSESDIGGIKDWRQGDLHRRRLSQAQLRRQPSHRCANRRRTVQNVVTYDVVVSVDNADLALKPGMTAATQIVIDQRNDVLRVPSQALRYAPATAGASRRGGTSAKTGQAPASQGLGAARRQAGAGPGDRRSRRRHLHRNRQRRTEGRRPGHHRRTTHATAASRRRRACRCDAANGPRTDHGGTDHQARARHADLPRRRYRRACAARRQPHRRCRRIRRHHGLLGLRQVDADGGARLPRPAEQRALFFRRHRRRRLERARARAAAQRTPRLRVPELQSAVAHQRDRERGVAAVLRGIRAGRRGLARRAGARVAQAARA